MRSANSPANLLSSGPAEPDEESQQGTGAVTGSSSGASNSCSNGSVRGSMLPTVFAWSTRRRNAAPSQQRSRPCSAGLCSQLMACGLCSNTRAPAPQVKVPVRGNDRGRGAGASKGLNWAVLRNNVAKRKAEQLKVNEEAWKIARAKDAHAKVGSSPTRSDLSF